jgi:iron complex transport system permease protein
LIPLTLILGASLALLADLIARLPGTASTLPVNAVTALIGAPVIIWVLLKNRSTGSLS